MNNPIPTKGEQQRPTWKQIVLKYEQPALRHGFWQLINTLVPYATLWYLMYLSLEMSYWLTGVLTLLAGGISAAIVGHISRNWPFAALVVLIAVSGLMSAFTGRQLRKIRVAAGFTGGIKVTGEAKPDELAASQAAFNPLVSTVTGGAGLAIILWLMVLKPF